MIAGKSKIKNISKGPLHSKGISVDLRPTCVDTSTEDYPRRICLAFKPTTGLAPAVLPLNKFGLTEPYANFLCALCEVSTRHKGDEF